MKLAGARAAAFCAQPDLGLKGALLHGPDGGLLALRRRELVEILTDGDDLRLTRLDPGAAQKDAAEIDAALRAMGFFPGRRVVLIEGARDSLAGPLGQVMAECGPGDAFLVVTAEGLGARSALRRLFEGGRGLVSLGLYPDAPDAAEIAALLAAAGLRAGLTPEAARMLEGAAAGIDRGSLAQLVEKIAVHGLDRETALGTDELEQLLPAAADSELDRLVTAVADGQAAAVGPMIARLTASGAGPVAMLIAAERHFRQLLGLASAGDGIDAALGRLRPPAFGARRSQLAAQARRWGPTRLETASRLLFQADRGLRAPGTRPDRALVERCLIRLAMMAGR
ncbi:MAG TPA: DNA polymerase III subunit delta [Thermohalobaculum sp.]|nr:DNA polymerase III subunit delta [Thermohalobaculum sp.]